MRRAKAARRFPSVAIALAFGLGAAPAAWATDQPKDKQDKQSGAHGGPSTGPSGSVGGGAPTGESPEERRASTQVELRKGSQAPKKIWEIGAVYELHGSLVRNDLEGLISPWTNIFYLYGRVDVTKNNRLSLRGGIAQGYYIDPGEPSVRFSDLALTYTRSFPLPQDFLIQAALSVTAPTGYSSQRHSIITAPSFALTLAKSYKGLYASLRGFGQYWFVKCSTGAGTASYLSSGGYDCGQAADATSGAQGANTRYDLSTTLDLSYSFWFHPSLTIGADASTDWSQSYGIQGSGLILSGYKDPVNPTGDKTFPNPPIQQSYGGEAYVRYSMPPVKGVKLDLLFAYANNLPLLHDGAPHIYGYFRLGSTLYGTATLRY